MSRVAWRLQPAPPATPGGLALIVGIRNVTLRNGIGRILTDATETSADIIFSLNLGL